MGVEDFDPAWSAGRPDMLAYESKPVKVENWDIWIARR